MAKENKKTAESAAQVTTVDNIRENLDSASMGRAELAAQALAKIKEQQDEKTKNEMKNRFQKASYYVDSELLNLRRERDIASVTKEKLCHIDRLKRHLMGFVVTKELIGITSKTADIFEKETTDAKNETITVVISGEKKTFKVGEEVPPIIDYVDYDDLYEKIKNKMREKMNEVENTHSTYKNKLRAKYGDYWNSSWFY